MVKIVSYSLIVIYFLMIAFVVFMGCFEMISNLSNIAGLIVGGLATIVFLFFVVKYLKRA